MRLVGLAIRADAQLLDVVLLVERVPFRNPGELGVVPAVVAAIPGGEGEQVARIVALGVGALLLIAYVGDELVEAVGPNSAPVGRWRASSFLREILRTGNRG